MKWIKVSERLPQKGDLYFVKVKEINQNDSDWFPDTCNFYDEWQMSGKEYIVIEWLDETMPQGGNDEPSVATGDAQSGEAGKPKKEQPAFPDFLPVLEENYQAQIAGFYNYDKTEEERKIRNAVIEEYQDLIAIYKSRCKSASSPTTEEGVNKKVSDGIIYMTEERIKEIAYIAWRGAADAYRMYPDQKHSFTDYWDLTKDRIVKFIENDPQIEYHLKRMKHIQQKLKENYEQEKEKK